MDLPQGRVDLQIWDYGGQLVQRPLISKFLEGTTGALLMFDLTRSSSFQELEEWHSILNSKLNIHIPILLVGCKDDICEQNPAMLTVPDNQTQEYVQKTKCVGYMKTSAKTGKNVKFCFEVLVNALLHER